MNPTACIASAALALLAAGNVASAQSNASPASNAAAYREAPLLDEKARVVECMKIWDSTTHMTRKEWEATCRRVAKERVKYLREQGYGNDGKKAPMKSKRSAR